MRRRLGRIFGVLLIVVMLFSLTACSKSNDVSNGEDKEKKVIKLFHRFPDEPFNSFIEKIVAE